MNISKKFTCVAVALLFVFCLSSCSGGTSEKTEAAFNSAKNTYTNLISDYEKIDAIGSDIYEAWRFGIYEDETITFSSLCEGLNLTVEDLNSAADSLAYPGVGRYIFYQFGDTEKFNICIALVKEAYSLNGTYEEIETLLNNAKSEMKTMSEQYSDYEHYDNLKKCIQL